MNALNGTSGKTTRDELLEIFSALHIHSMSAFSFDSGVPIVVGAQAGYRAPEADAKAGLLGSLRDTLYGSRYTRSASQDGAAFTTGLLTNLLNPKVGVFYVSFLPQFVPQGVPAAPYMLLLGVIHAILGVTWFGCLIAATRPLTRVLQRPRVVVSCDRLTGGMFVAFGVGLAAQRSTP